MGVDTVTVQAPAPGKLNLFLRITGRRADGYHLLQTVFQFIDYGDVLDFTLTDDDRIRRRHPLPGVPEATDLTVRAAHVLRETAHARGHQVPGVEIGLQKNLPLGGGLGGGSSDAATTLVTLNRLWKVGLHEDALATLGLRLGADVPVFVRGRAAWAEGVGEQLTPIEPAEPWYLVIVPACRVATAEIFRAAELTRQQPSITISDFLRDASSAGDVAASLAWGNVTEPVVRARYPDVARALDWLSAQAVAARLTGTGACVFAPFATHAQAEQVRQRLPPEMTGFVTRGRNRSPLFEPIV